MSVAECFALLTFTKLSYELSATGIVGMPPASGLYVSHRNIRLQDTRSYTAISFARVIAILVSIVAFRRYLLYMPLRKRTCLTPYNHSSRYLKNLLQVYLRWIFSRTSG